MTAKIKKKKMKTTTLTLSSIADKERGDDTMEESFQGGGKDREKEAET